MAALCTFCKGSPRKGRIWVRDRKPPYLMGWLRCSHCKGTGHYIPVSERAKAKAS